MVLVLLRLPACLVQAPYIHMLYIMKNVLSYLTSTLQALPNLSCALNAVSTHWRLVRVDTFAQYVVGLGRRIALRHRLVADDWLR